MITELKYIMENYCKLYVQSTSKNEIDNILQFWKTSMKISDKDIFLYIDENDERDEKKALSFKDGFIYYSYLVEIDSETLDLNIVINFVSKVMNSFLEKNILVIGSCDYENYLPVTWSNS